MVFSSCFTSRVLLCTQRMSLVGVKLCASRPWNVSPCAPSIHLALSTYAGQTRCVRLLQWMSPPRRFRAKRRSPRVRKAWESLSAPSRRLKKKNPDRQKKQTNKQTNTPPQKKTPHKNKQTNKQKNHGILKAILRYTASRNGVKTEVICKLCLSVAALTYNCPSRPSLGYALPVDRTLNKGNKQTKLYPCIMRTAYTRARLGMFVGCNGCQDSAIYTFTSGTRGACLSFSPSSPLRRLRQRPQQHSSWSLCYFLWRERQGKPRGRRENIYPVHYTQKDCYA